MSDQSDEIFSLSVCSFELKMLKLINLLKLLEMIKVINVIKVIKVIKVVKRLKYSKLCQVSVCHFVCDFVKFRQK